MAKGSSGLGRGLDALMGGAALQSQESGSVMLPISQVEASLKQPRKYFDEESLADLAESIRTHGILQPITVRRLASGYYQIISGERRWRAARMAHLDEVPVIIVEADDRKAMELGLIENLQREDLNPMEEAHALRLLALPTEITALVESGQLSGGHARALLAVKDKQAQLKLARRVVDEDLSVRQVEAAVKQLEKAPKAVKVPDPQEVNYIAEAEKNLGSRLGRKIHIVTGRKKGRLELEYYGEDDLNALLEALEQLRLPGKGGAAQ